jgi:hypothetical protein
LRAGAREAWRDEVRVMAMLARPATADAAGLAKHAACRGGAGGVSDNAASRGRRLRKDA